jgi:predicted amidohydrolase
MDQKQEMKICVTQTRPVKGDIQANIVNHKKLIELAIADKPDLIIFPELSLTGYEPKLAKELATDKDDTRFNDLQTISDNNHVTIGVGMPIKAETGVLIGMIIFQPNKPRDVYCKQHLHADEYPFFIEGTAQVFLNEESKNKTALAICYELSVAEHSFNAFNHGAANYVASVAKTADGIEKAGKTLTDIAKKYSMTVFMSNCIGPCDDFESAGRTSVWNNQGVLVGQLNDKSEGVLIFDPGTNEMIEVLL